MLVLAPIMVTWSPVFAFVLTATETLFNHQTRYIILPLPRLFQPIRTGHDMTPSECLPNRRTFLKASALFATGISALFSRA